MLPSDNANIANFLNFSDVGVSTLKQSAAFAKIRANSKLFNTNVVSSVSEFTAKYHKVNKLAFSESMYAEATLYGNVRQHNLLASAASSNNLKTFLNETDLLPFLNNTKDATFCTTTNTAQLLTIANTEFYKNLNESVSTTNFYLNQIKTINSASDRKPTSYAFDSTLSTSYKGGSYAAGTAHKVQPAELPLSLTTPTFKAVNLNSEQLNNELLVKGVDTGVLAADQLVRNYDSIGSRSSNFNLTPVTNVVTSLLQGYEQSSPIKNTSSNLNGLSAGCANISQSAKLLSRRVSLGYPHPLLLSNNPYLNIFEYDTNASRKTTVNFASNKVAIRTTSKGSPTNGVIYGDQANSVASLNAAY